MQICFGRESEREMRNLFKPKEPKWKKQQWFSANGPFQLTVSRSHARALARSSLEECRIMSKECHSTVVCLHSAKLLFNWRFESRCEILICNYGRAAWKSTIERMKETEAGSTERKTVQFIYRRGGSSQSNGSSSNGNGSAFIQFIY